MTDRPVRVLLDASAVVAYTRTSDHVGEVIAEVTDETDETGRAVAFGIPLPCLVEATWAVADTDRLDVLVSHTACELLADDPQDWRALAAMRDLVGRPDAASAAWLALDLEVGLLTAQPGLYAGVAGLYVIAV